MSSETSKNAHSITMNYCLTSLGEVTDSSIIQRAPQAKFVYFDIGSVNRESKSFVDLKLLAPEEAPSRARQVVRPNDILVSMTRPNLNAIAIVPVRPEDLIASTGFHVLRSDWVESKFLYYLVQTDAFVEAMTAVVQGALYPAVRPRDISNFEFYLPPRQEQVRIVEKLEELLSDLDAGVAELKAAQRKLTQYRQSLLKAAMEGTLTADWRAARAKSGEPQETGADLLQRILTERRTRWEARQLAKFAEQKKAPPKHWQAKYPEPLAPDTTDLPLLPQGWAWASIEQVAADEPYSLAIGPFGSNLTVADYSDDGVPLVFVRNIRSHVYGGAATKFVTEEKATELKAHRVDAGDVLVTKMGEPPGDADVYPSGQPAAIITADCIKIRCQVGLMMPQFLSAAINSSIGRKQIRPMTQGVAQKKVSLGRFSSLAVPLPPSGEQAIAVERLLIAMAEGQAQDRMLEHGLRQAVAQRKNILKAALSGQLVPQDPNDEPASVLLARIRAERARHDVLGKKLGRTPRKTA